MAVKVIFSRRDTYVIFQKILSDLLISDIAASPFSYKKAKKRFRILEI